MELSQALPLAESLVDRVRCVTGRCEVAGSVRRRKPTVKDIELVVLVDDYAGFYRRLGPAGRFIKPGVPNVVDWPTKPGAKYVRMLLNEGIKLDVFVASPANWGGIFMMRTGSGVGPDGSPFTGFVPMMFSRWKKVSKGGKMSGGQPTLPDGTMLEVPEEEDVFRLFEARWVPPEERTSADAIHSTRHK